MPEKSSGVDTLRAQVERRSRAVAPPRHPRPAQSRSDRGPEEAGVTEGGESPVAGPPSPVAEEPRESRTGVKRKGDGPAVGKPTTDEHVDRPVTTTNDPVTNLAVRVRRPLDNRLGDVVHSFRNDGVRVSKVEIIEMLLWELPADASPDFRNRLAAFRRAAPREETL